MLYRTESRPFPPPETGKIAFKLGQVLEAISQRTPEHPPPASTMQRPALARPQALHKTRIRLKRARYATELAAATTGKPAQRVIKRAKKLQDILGQHQDAIVAQREIRKLARVVDGCESARMAGRLIERQKRRAADARTQLRDAWKRVDKASKAAW